MSNQLPNTDPPIEMKAQGFCAICDESIKGDETMGIASHDEKSCEKALDLIVSDAVAMTADKFGSDLPDSELEESLTRVLRTRSEEKV